MSGTATGVPQQQREPGLWKAALWRLALLGAFFFISYGFANQVSEQRAIAGDVGSIVFDWERHIPLWPWTIVPYWSIDLLYAISVFTCTTRRELSVHCWRLLTVQVIAVTCFLLAPLRFAWERPAIDGPFGAMFDLLMGFDKPFNQAPSLHIALLVVLWLQFGRHLHSRWGRALLHGWFVLIGLSVLTTWQHHFIDVPTGALLGFFVVWLWPQEASAAEAVTAHPQQAGTRRRLAGGYALGATALAALALAGGQAGHGTALWLLWPAIALMMVASFYAWGGAAGFQKRTSGRHSTASRVLLAPYTLAAWLNARCWTRRHPHPCDIGHGLWLGRLPGQKDLADMRQHACMRLRAVVDLCAELPFPPAAAGGRQASIDYQTLPWLDLVVPDAHQCRAAADAIEAARQRHPQGTILVCCALGYSRSAMAAASWMLWHGGASSAAEAEAWLRRHRPQVVLRDGHRQVLQEVATHALAARP
ncbi:phosphatase PAP2 family protein [Corticibacter populi]|uniref:Phosphatase PAP2 family protein n=1 Tax=Corticibacter populi TaxID=1550736 RepID=A0A3M6QP34_9BURK|nr:phosphatase PAP2/dual specificity phosphatase family protein [Corticibacter populi]RMX04807.1 phosphatase PAP2 family protein [Corticibacter populi]RZS33780.1 dual specificity protein phosphatase-like protein [Corticibacter populi]